MANSVCMALPATRRRPRPTQRRSLPAERLDHPLRRGRPDVLEVAVVRHQAGEPGLGVGCRSTGALLEHASERLPDIRRHTGRVPADEDHRPLLEQPPHLLALLLDRLLYVGLRRAGLARERGVYPGDPGCFERPQLVLVEEILERIAAAEKEQGLANWNPLLLERSTLLQEAAERRNAGAGAYHDHGQV